MGAVLQKSIDDLRTQLTDVEKEVMSLRVVKQQQTAELEAALQVTVVHCR